MTTCQHPASLHPPTFAAILRDVLEQAHNDSLIARSQTIRFRADLDQGDLSGAGTRAAIDAPKGLCQPPQTRQARWRSVH